MNQPKVSVIIPVYNAEQYLRQCLDSVLGQSLTEIEVICVDDCSKDDSFSILKEYQRLDSRVVILKNENNINAGPSRNRGLEVAKGEYVHFLDADDFLEKDAYTKLYQIVSDRKPDVVRTKAYDYNSQTGEITLGNENALKTVPKRMMNKTICFLDVPELFLSVTVVPWAGWYNREFLIKENIRFNNLVCVNDRSFFCETVVKAKRIVFADLFLNYYRIGISTSLIGRRGENFHCHFESYHIIEKHVNGLPKYVKKQCLEREIDDICYWVSRLNHSEHIKTIHKGVYTFVNTMDKSPWNGAVENTYWYKKLEDMIALLAIDRIERKENCEQPKVSIVMPVYNAERYLVQAVTSVLNQSLQEIELICVDDGSTDESVSILEKMASIDKRMQIICQKNLYAGVARNNGIQHAKGQYLTFLDSDDIMLPKALERLYSLAEESFAEVIISEALFFNYKNKPRKANWVLNRGHAAGEKIIETKSKKTLFQISTGEPWAKMFRRSFIEEKGIRFPTLPRAEDLYFVFLSYSEAEKIAVLLENTVMYRKVDGEGLEAQKDRFPLAPFQSRMLLYEKLKENGKYDFLEQSFINNMIDCVVYNLKDMKSYEGFEAFYHEFKDNIVPKLKIDLSERDYYLNANNYDYVKELVNSNNCAEFLFSQYKQYSQISQYKQYSQKKTGGSNNNDSSKDEIMRIHSSLSYRIGRAITFIPRKVRGVYRCYREHGARYTWRRILTHLRIK